MIKETEISEQLSQQLLKNLHRWIQCIAVISFDIEEGQKVQKVIPKTTFTKQTEKQLAMLSFPDSNSFSDTENIFKYTFKLTNGLYGFTCFKQKKDKSNARGYCQKSMVILSQLPFIQFFQKMVQFIVFKCFQKEGDELDDSFLKICHQVASWPDPTPKSTHVLPILTYQVQIKIPNYVQVTSKQNCYYTNRIGELQLQVDLQQNNKQYSFYQILSQQLLKRSGLFQQIKIYDLFLNFPEAVWTLWECVMLNKSVLIMGSNPQQVSHAVLGIISLINPFVYCGNVNPYTTVYDPNLDKLQQQPFNWIFGGTNPLFQKLFKKQVVEIVNLQPKYKAPKHLKALKQIFIGCKNQEERVVNELAIRKYFYKLSRSLMNLIDYELNTQANSLKFFNEKEFLRKLKDRKDFYGLEEAFSSKKYLLIFFQKFLTSANFQNFLRERNAIRTKK